MAIILADSTYGALASAATMSIQVSPVAGEQGVAILTLHKISTVARPAGSPRYNGSAMTFIASAAQGSTAHIEAWYHFLNSSATATIEIPNCSIASRPIIAFLDNVSSAAGVKAINATAGVGSLCTAQLASVSTAQTYGLYGITHQNNATGLKSHTLIREFDEGAWVSGLQGGILLTNPATMSWSFTSATAFTGVLFSFNPNTTVLIAPVAPRIYPTIDAVPFRQTYGFVPVPAQITPTATPPALTIETALNIEDVVLRIATINAIAPSNGEIRTSSGIVTFFITNLISPTNGNIALSATVPALTQKYQLSCVSNAIVVTASSPTIEQGLFLNPVVSEIRLSVAQVSITQKQILSIPDNAIRISTSTITISAGVTRTYYQTTFPATENPISEDDNWLNGGTDGLVWSDVRTIGGNAISTQTNDGHYNDAVALVKGNWIDDQYVKATVFRGNPSDNIAEVELWLRGEISANWCRGYEIYFSVKGQYDAMIVLWDGPKDTPNFHLLSGHNIGALNDGDVLAAKIIGTVISVYRNDMTTPEWTYDTNGDSTKWSDGKPGIGFYSGDPADNVEFGWKDFEASDPTSPPSGNITITCGAVTLSISNRIAPSDSNIQIASSSPAIGVGVIDVEDVELRLAYLLSINAGQINITAIPVSISIGGALSISTSSIIISSATPAILQTHSFTATGNIRISCSPVNVSIASDVIATASTITITSDIASITQKHEFMVSGNIRLSCDTVGLSVGGALAVTSGSVNVTAATPAITQTHALSVFDGSIKCSSADPVILQTHALAVVLGSIRISAGAVSVDQGGALQLASGEIKVTTGSVPFIQRHNLSSTDCSLKVTTLDPVLVQSHNLSAVDGRISVSAGDLSLSLGQSTIPQSGAIKVSCGSVTLTQAYTLAVDGGFINPTVDAIVIEQYHVLQMTDCAVRISCTDPSVVYKRLGEIIDPSVSSFTRSRGVASVSGIRSIRNITSVREVQSE